MEEKEQRKSVNFETQASLNVYDGGWDDEFDDDSEDDAMSPETPSLIHEKYAKALENIELNEVGDQVEIRKEQTFQIPINDTGISDKRASKRRGSLMNRRRNTIYEPKPDNFTCDPTLASPIEARIITDICCFMLFFVFLAIWGFSICLVFNMGNLERFSVPKNSKAEICQGKYPFELNLNLVQCLDPLVAFKTCRTQSVCVDKCPNLSFSFPYYERQKNYSIDAKVPTKLRNTIKCVGNPDLKTMGSVEKFIKNQECAKITTKSFTFNGSNYKEWNYKCIPDIFNTELDFIIDLFDDIIPQTNIPWRITYQFSKHIGAIDEGNLTAIEESTMYTLTDMLEGSPVLIGFLIIALFITVLMVYSMQYLANFIFIITNVLNAILLATSIYICYMRGRVFDEFSFELFHNDIWGLSLIFTSVVAIIVALQFLIERKGTLIILELIKEMTNTIKYIKTLLVFPLIFYCIRVAAILISMYIGFTIKSTSETDYKYHAGNLSSCNCDNNVEGKFCSPTVVTKCTSERFDSYDEICTGTKCEAISESHNLPQKLVNFSQLTNLVGYFWASEYLYLLEHAILASTFATYYWTFHKRDIPRFTLFNGFYTSVRYHLGTIFFAWLFLCIYSYIRYEFYYVDHFLGFLPFSIVHFFFKYVVIVMSLCGDDFYESAKEVISIVKQNARLIIISKFMSEILFFYLKLIIAGVMGILVYMVVLIVGLISPGYFKHDLFPVYIVCMGTYLIATEIFNIFILGVDTFTFCYIEDVTLNDGEMSSPYFMPRPLMRICNLKNKLDKDAYDGHNNSNHHVPN